MFIVTNRMVNEQGKTPSEIFGEKPAEGPNELRLAEARRQGKQWQLDLLPDQITAEMAASVGLDPDLPHPASAYVARKLLERCAGTGSTAKQKLKTGKHLLLFVHGFNNQVNADCPDVHRLGVNFNASAVQFAGEKGDYDLMPS
ncbi:hypothetical protein [Aeromonas caviae]|uniref:hypothetical protein n=1 Tax=Aeromonas caviae TaxID=648 RepID=UPI002379B46B|nr:hypothetical protein [Aeromonas caviae]